VDGRTAVWRGCKRDLFIARRPNTLLLAAGMADLLIVDDDFDGADALADIMRAEGYGVRVGHDGEEGLRLAGDRLPDLALIDVQMPVLGGPGMVHGMLIHDMGLETVPVIFMSGSPNVDEVAAEVGTPYFLRKPFAAAEATTLVRHALTERRLPSPRGARSPQRP
jgi:DNA-binding NtrC family response regulator